MSSSHVIEFNGKRYDAVTGAVLGNTHVIPRHIMDRYAPVRKRRIIDGFKRRHQPESEPEPIQEPEQTQAATDEPELAKVESEVVVPVKVKRKPKPKPARAVAGHVKPHQPQHSKTLLRRHAPKPKFDVKPAVKRVRTPAEIAPKQAAQIAHKRSVYSVDPIRERRAITTTKHRAVQHFKSTPIHSVSAQVAVLPVEIEPFPVAAAQQTIALPAKHHNDIFTNAIARATSHEQPAPKTRRSRKRKLANALAVVGALLIVGGFIGYLNLENIQMRVASMQAGFSASLPDYAPTGYTLQGRVERNGSTIALDFRSGDQGYRITQQPSNWNSETLLDNTLGWSTEFQTVQKNGQTIYIFSEGDIRAAWVNGGVRYEIAGNAHLSEYDIISIATSL